MEKRDLKYLWDGDNNSAEKRANKDKCEEIKGRKSFIEGVKAEPQTDCFQN